MNPNPHLDYTPATGREVRARRHALGWTVVRLAVEADCSTTFLETVERGAVPKRSALVPRILATLAAAEAAEVKAQVVA